MIQKTPAMQLQDKKKRFTELLKLDALEYMDMTLFSADRQFHIDIYRLEDYLKANKNMKEDESMGDCLMREYGKEAMEFVEANL